MLRSQIPRGVIALGCVLLIVFGVEEPEATQQVSQPSFPISRVNLRRLPARFWWVVTFAAVLTLARFSEAFLLLLRDVSHLGAADSDRDERGLRHQRLPLGQTVRQR